MTPAKYNMPKTCLLFNSHHTKYNTSFQTINTLVAKTILDRKSGLSRHDISPAVLKALSVLTRWILVNSVDFWSGILQLGWVTSGFLQPRWMTSGFLLNRKDLCDQWSSVSRMDQYRSLKLEWISVTSIGLCDQCWEKYHCDQHSSMWQAWIL